MPLCIPKESNRKEPEDVLYKYTLDENWNVRWDEIDYRRFCFKQLESHLKGIVKWRLNSEVLSVLIQRKKQFTGIYIQEQIFI